MNKLIQLLMDIATFEVNPSRMFFILLSIKDPLAPSQTYKTGRCPPRIK